MKLSIKKMVDVEAKELRILLKVRDRFRASLHDQDGQEVCSQEDGYVPNFMPGEHCGDYVILDIDIETGMIKNWRKNEEELRQWINGCLHGDSED